MPHPIAATEWNYSLRFPHSHAGEDLKRLNSLMASLSTRWIYSTSNPQFQRTASTRRRSATALTCKAKDAGGDRGGGGGGGSVGAVQIAAAASALIANPVIGISLYALKTTGCGLPPGPGGALGAVEGVSYLVAAGIVVWSLYTKSQTGSGLPSGPFGLLGAAEGLSYLSVVAIIVVFGLQFWERGYLPGPLPGDQCFG